MKIQRIIDLCLSNDGGAFRNVDTVQEDTAILVLGSGRLLDHGSRLGNVFDGRSAEDDFVLLVGGLDGDIPGHFNATNALLTHIITDFNGLLVIDDGNVNGEMAVSRAHLELEALGDTLDHILDVGADGTNTGEILALTEPNGNADFTGLLGHFDSDVFEVALEGSTGTGDLDAAGSDFNLDVLGDNDKISLVNELHY